ncbi:MAG: DUF1365 domain-containing protein [Emcibacteraceae bacterium]|nr:DUF1365 domain-containing protein [Emcibacteraceae bacterium]
MTKNCLYIGSVFHKRFAPKKHELRYNVFTLFSDLDALNDIANETRFFSLNRFNLVSFHETDYGDPNEAQSAGLKQRLHNLLNQNDIDAEKISTIKVLAYPRVLGFAFNPLTVFYCYGENDKNIAIIYEVRNTFSERHNYIYAVPDGASFKDQHIAQKCFHVSPFFDSKGTYNFSLVLPDEKVAVTIDYKNAEQARLKACFSGSRAEFSDRVLLKLCLKMPFMTLKVMGGILYEAIKLKLKGLQVHPHSEPHKYQSTKAITINKKQD